MIQTLKDKSIKCHDAVCGYTANLQWHSVLWLWGRQVCGLGGPGRLPRGQGASAGQKTKAQTLLMEGTQPRSELKDCRWDYTTPIILSQSWLTSRWLRKEKYRKILIVVGFAQWDYWGGGFGIRIFQMNYYEPLKNKKSDINLLLLANRPARIRDSLSCSCFYHSVRWFFSRKHEGNFHD